MQEVQLADVCDEISKAFEGGNLRRVDELIWPALDQFPDLAQLWFYAGNLFFRTGRCALAMVCFERCIHLDTNPAVYANLGATLRRLQLHDAGETVLRTGMERFPDYEPTLINLGSMYVNEGSPELGIPPLERACELGEKKGVFEKGARWNLGLLYLESGRFKEGFEFYRTGLGQERQQRIYAYDVKLDTGETLVATEPEWLQPDHVGTGKTLIVYGEQGIGDELMIATLLEEARAEFGEVIFECHPRLERLHRNAHPGMRIFPTRKDKQLFWPIQERIQADYKAPIFDLAARYRPDLQSFLNKQTLLYVANPREEDEYSAWLRALANGRPIVALGTRGGVPNTARQYRTIRTNDLDHLFESTDALFVSVDYDDMSEFAVHVHEKFGPGRFLWSPAIVQHWDYEHTAALIAACDLTVTVCQSAFHMSAGMGQRTVGLVPKRCAWRYAEIKESPELSYWYPFQQIQLFRQAENDDWRGPLDRAIEVIRGVKP